MSGSFVPYVPAERRVRELTVRAAILGAFLAIVLGAANAYLGLRVGLTVSASIPAAVMSMAILRALRNHSILENNLVQTAASAGESLAAGVIFTIPALIFLGAWEDIHYLETTLIALAGGVLGVLFTVPLRRALIVEAQLTFPEGVATSEVLKAGEGGAGTGVWALGLGLVAGALFKFMETGLTMWRQTLQYGTRFREQGVVSFGSELSPALLAVGYIIGLRIAVLVFAGGVIGWLVAIPNYSLFASDTSIRLASGDLFDFALPGLDPGAAAGQLWSNRIRYMGVGAMLVGGVWSIVKLRRPLGQALRQGMGLQRSGADVPRTEQELGMRPTLFAVLGMVVPITLLYAYTSGSMLVAVIMGLVMVVTGFLFSAVAGYMAGLVGSSNNPISGVTILTVLASALTLRFVLGVDTGTGPTTTILVAAVIACAAAIAGDNMQDLKAGHLLGSTPKKQQLMQILGVTAIALAIAPILQRLIDTYGFGFGPGQLTAAQAALMAAVADFVFTGGVPLLMITVGALIAVALVVMDEVLAARGSEFRTPVMPVAVGIYLPVGLTTPIFIGGLVAFFAHRAYGRSRSRPVLARRERGLRDGTLLASGLIAGEAILGILLAFVIQIDEDSGLPRSILAVSDGSLLWPGALLFGFLAFLLWYVAARPAVVEG